MACCRVHQNKNRTLAPARLNNVPGCVLQDRHVIALAFELALLLGSLTKQLPKRFYAGIEGQPQGALEYHPIIMNAIRMKDSEAVRSLMHRHILSAAEHLIEML